MLPVLAAHNAIRPQLADNTTPDSYVLDLADHANAKAVLWLFKLGATDVAATAMKVQESDTKTDATTLGGTPSDVKAASAMPGATDDGNIYGILVPLDGSHKRYHQAVFTAGDGTSGIYVDCTALVVGGDSDFDATDMGLAALYQA
jgi:hypothetical protein